MANDLNQCNFIGRLGRDPELRYLPNGDAVASMALAVGSQWKDKSGEKQEATEWVNLTAFAKTAEICGQYLKKGSRIFVTGRMKTDKYDDKEGVTRYSTKVVVERMQMLDNKTDGQPAQQQAAKPAPAQRPTGGGSSSGFDDFDSDIPF